MDSKNQVKEFWNEASCGESLYLKGESPLEQFEHQLKNRYRLEPFIPPFAEFEKQRNKRVLEIGVGLGADHQMFAQNGAILYGCDLTDRAIAKTKERFRLLGLNSTLAVADAENLPFASDEFDLVYSWGVIHHSPNTEKAIEEIYRVLKKGGKAKIMIYYKYSLVGIMLWIRYGLFRLRPLTSLDYIYSRYLESPGTKAYSIPRADKMLRMFSKVSIKTVLTHGDLLSSKAGQRHEGLILNIARRIYPRTIIKSLFPRNGLFMLIDALK